MVAEVFDRILARCPTLQRLVQPSAAATAHTYIVMLMVGIGKTEYPVLGDFLLVEALLTSTEWLFDIGRTAASLEEKIQLIIAEFELEETSGI